MNLAAQSLGRLGGLAKSEAKTAAARANAKKGGWPKGKKRKKQPGKRTGRKAVGIPAVDAPLGLATMREKALRMPAEGNGKTKTAVVGGSGHPAYQKQGTPCVHSSNPSRQGTRLVPRTLDGVVGSRKNKKG